MPVTTTDMEAALKFLADTDEEYARVRALHEGLSNQRPVVRSHLFMRSAEKSATAREHQAQSSRAYEEHLNAIKDANEQMLVLQAKRHTAGVRIDCWRSLNAARNKGQIV